MKTKIVENEKIHTEIEIKKNYADNCFEVYIKHSDTPIIRQYLKLFRGDTMECIMPDDDGFVIAYGLPNFNNSFLYKIWKFFNKRKKNV